MPLRVLLHKPGLHSSPHMRPSKKKSTDADGHLWTFIGGDEEDRTPDLCIANAALSQLSYTPNFLLLRKSCDLRRRRIMHESLDKCKRYFQAMRLKITVPLVPPKPKLFFMAARISHLTGVSLQTRTQHSGS